MRARSFYRETPPKLEPLCPCLCRLKSLPCLSCIIYRGNFEFSGAESFRRIARCSRDAFCLFPGERVPRKRIDPRPQNCCFGETAERRTQMCASISAILPNSNEKLGKPSTADYVFSRPFLESTQIRQFCPPPLFPSRFVIARGRLLPVKNLRFPLMNSSSMTRWNTN